jgi:hypothetical protein
MTCKIQIHYEKLCLWKLNQITLPLKLKKQLIYNYCATILLEIQGINK